MANTCSRVPAWTPYSPFKARDTVDTLTPDSRATSLIVIAMIVANVFDYRMWRRQSKHPRIPTGYRNKYWKRLQASEAACVDAIEWRDAADGSDSWRRGCGPERGARARGARISGARLRAQ